MSTNNKPALIAETMRKFQKEVHKVLKGCENALGIAVRTMLANGHTEFVGVPGTGKTLMAAGMAAALDVKAAVFTFLPDQMPGDIIGTEVWNPAERRMEPAFGKIHPEAQIVVGDEYNRAPPKTVNACLEPMQNGILHIGNQRLEMKRPFFILVRNPIEQAGTYVTPEAVKDRLAASAYLDYPTFEQTCELADDRNVIKQDPVKAAGITKVLDSATLHDFQNFVSDAVEVPPPVREYIVRLVFATRPPRRGTSEDNGDNLYNKYMPAQYKDKELIYVGCSNRAVIWLSACARANAVMNGRSIVTDQDIKDMAVPVLAHRVTLNEQKLHLFPRDVEGSIISELLKVVPTT